MSDPRRTLSRVALVLPCYRPAPGWVERIVSRAADFAEVIAPADLKLVVVHDGTPGGLAAPDLARLQTALPDLRFIDHPRNHGKGHALRAGIAAAQADLYLYTDIDLPYTTASMLAVVRQLVEAGGVAAGERFSDYYAGVPQLRRVLSRGHRFAMRTLFRLPVSDSQAGLKGFDESGRRVFLETTVDRFLVDLDFIARCRGRVSVAPVRVELRPDVQFTDFGLAILRAEAGNFARILWRSWRGKS